MLGIHRSTNRRSEWSKTVVNASTKPTWTSVCKKAEEESTMTLENGQTRSPRTIKLQWKRDGKSKHNHVSTGKTENRSVLIHRITNRVVECLDWYPKTRPTQALRKTRPTDRWQPCHHLPHSDRLMCWAGNWRHRHQPMYFAAKTISCYLLQCQSAMSNDVVHLPQPRFGGNGCCSKVTKWRSLEKLSELKQAAPPPPLPLIPNTHTHKHISWYVLDGFFLLLDVFFSFF